MGLLGNKKKESFGNEEIKILSTQIETINQQLTSINNTKDDKLFKEIDSKLSYIYDLIQSINTETKPEITMNTDIKELIQIYKEEAEIFKQQNEYLQKRLDEMDKKIQYIIQRRT